MQILQPAALNVMQQQQPLYQYVGDLVYILCANAGVFDWTFLARV